MPTGWSVCANPAMGYSIAHPADWHTDALTPDQVCGLFDPERFRIPNGSEFPYTALQAYSLAREGSFPVALRALHDPVFDRVRAETTVTVAGLPGVRLETVATGQGELERGTRRYGYLIDRPAGPFFVGTTGIPGASYRQHKSVVDRAVRTLHFFAPSPQPFRTSTVTRRGTADEVMVSGVRAGRHPGFDRLVFNVQGADAPTVELGYVEDGSTIHVAFEALGSPSVSPHASHAGPATTVFGMRALRAVSFTVHGAGALAARVTTTHRHGFRVSVLQAPTRVVLDIAH